MSIPSSRFFVFLLLVGGLFLSLNRADAQDHTLRVYWIDCDGGSSTLIVTPRNESILIDAGFPGPRDPGRILAAAKDAGITQIDHFILTHFHSDHFGGAPVLAKLMPIREVYDKGIPKRIEDTTDARSEEFFAQRVRPYAEMQVGKRIRLQPGMIIPLEADSGAETPLQLRCIAVDEQFVSPRPGQAKNPLSTTPGPDHKLVATENEHCAVFVLKFGRFRFYDGGDMNWYQEEKLVTPYDLVGPIDVYQADTHGLGTSSPPILLNTLTPTATVVPNGPGKGAWADAIARFRATPSIKDIYQIHRNTQTMAEDNTDPDKIANMDEGCTGECIKMSVAADGESYTISVPATGFSRTYQTTAKPVTD